MGCGSSSTSAEFRTFPKQEEQHSYIRKASVNDQRNGSAHSTRSQGQNGSVKQDARAASAMSRSSSASSTASKRKKKSLVERQSSSSTVDESNKTNETLIARKASAGSQRSISNDQHKQDDDRAKRENVEHENLIKAKLLLDESKADGHVQDGTNTKENERIHVVQSTEEHEKRAKLVEERRCKVDMDKDEARTLEEMCLPPIDVPDQPGNSRNHEEYTIDGIVNHNAEVGAKDWFKYGHKVYSAELMLPYVQDRMMKFKNQRYKDEEFPLFNLGGSHSQYDDRGDPESEVMAFKRGWPVFTARYYGVTRLELHKVLAVSLIGKVVEIDRESLLARLKQSVENTLEALDELDESENVHDFKDQLNRWLQDYPSVQVYNEIPQSGADQNEQTFPLPKPMLFDPLILRRWVEDWEALDTEVAEEGAWNRLELVNEELGDTHETFAALVHSHVDENIPDLDMSIDGEAGWNVIETDLLKNDTTTEEQDKTFSCRAKRKNINDPEWMKKRRSEIADSFIARHEMDPSVMSPFLPVYENLEKGWQQFQKLVEDNFIPPKRTAPDTSRMKERPLKWRQKSQDSIASSSINCKPTTTNGEEESINAFLTLPDEVDENSPKALENDDGAHEPMVLQSSLSGEDTSQLNSARSGDQVDNDRTAPVMEASGKKRQGGAQNNDATPGSLTTSPPKTPDRGQNKTEVTENNSTPEKRDDNIKVLDKASPSTSPGPVQDTHGENNVPDSKASYQHGGHIESSEPDRLDLSESTP